MKKFVFILLFFCIKATGQNNFKLDMDCFLIGLMNDYNGRIIPLKNEESSSYLANFELNERNCSALFLDSITKHYNVPKNEIIERDGFYYNKQLAKHFNEYYIVQIDSGMGFEIDGKEFEAYVLSLDIKKFDTSEKKISFLTGMIYSSGNFEENKIIINKANSPAFNLAIEFLKELQFEYIENKSNEYSIPTVQIVTFEPLKIYYDYFQKVREKIKNGG